MKLKKSCLQEFEYIYKNYMVKQFPSAELKPYKDFCELLRNTNNYILYTLSKENNVVGYTLLYIDYNLKFIWVDYIAILPEFYSKGYGKTFLNKLKENFSDLKGIYFEVEKPDEKKQNTLRRIKFYTTCGAKKLACEYFYPNKNGFIPMDLYFLPILSNEISKQDLLKDIYSVFKKIHSKYSHIEKVFSKIK